MDLTGEARLERAIEIAIDAHAGDTDKADAPYIRHPLRVMEQMDTETERVVAVLHDVIEDSEYTPQQIEAEFDAQIRDAVVALTKSPEEDYLEEFIPRTKNNDIARKVKRADIEDNMDLTRLQEVDTGVTDRLEKYHNAHQKLL